MIVISFNYCQLDQAAIVLFREPCATNQTHQQVTTLHVLAPARQPVSRVQSIRPITRTLAFEVQR